MTQRTWFFHLAEAVTEQQADKLGRDFESFLAVWNAHGNAIDGRISLKYSRFIVVQSHPQKERPSGCSIDSMTQAVETILANHALELLDSAYIFYKTEDGQISDVHFSKLKAKVEAGELDAETIIFDPSLNQTDDMSRWEIPLKESWMKKYLPTSALV